MSILNEETLGAFAAQGDELKARVKFWRDNTKLVAEYEGKQLRLETALSMTQAQKAADAADKTPLDIISVVCDDTSGLDGMPSTVALHIFEAYNEAVSKVQGVELGE